MLNVNTPILNAQLMTENPLSMVGIVAIVFVVLASTYIAVVAYKAEKAERNTAKLNSMDDYAELEAFGMPTAQETQQRASQAR